MQYNGKTRLVLKYLGFLTNDYGMNFAFQTFNEYEGFMGPIDTYSFYNNFGCFTLHNVVQKGEWGWFISRKISSNQYELLEKEILQTDYIHKRYWMFSSVLKRLASIINEQIKKTSSFFGIRIKTQGDGSSVLD